MEYWGGQPVAVLGGGGGGGSGWPCARSVGGATAMRPDGGGRRSGAVARTGEENGCR
jgi:hypothetical protein